MQIAKNIRDNSSVIGVFSAETCSQCGEMFDTGHIHVCKERNSFVPGTKTLQFRHKPIDSKWLLDTVEQFCDSDDNISFKTLCEIVYSFKA